MVKVIFIETFKKLLRSSKNQLLLIVSFLGVIIYSIFVLPNIESIDTIDMNKLEIDMRANYGVMQRQLDAGMTEINILTGQSTYQLAKDSFERQREFKIAIESGDARRYIQLSYLPEYLEEEIQEYYLMNSEEPFKDLSFDQINKQQRLNSYLNQQDISFHLIQEKTALQQVHLFLLNWGPQLILIFTVFLTSDILTMDRNFRTQKAGMPYSWRKYLFIQSIAAFCFVLFFLLIIFTWFMIFHGFLFGFGHLGLQVPDYTYHFDYTTNLSGYGLMQIGTFFLNVVPYLALFIYLMIRLSTLFSLLFKQTVITLGMGIFTIFFENLYYSRRTREIIGIDVSFFPQTYIDFGKVISGEKNFLLNTPTITVDRGIIVLISTILILELILLFVSKFVNRQRFVW